MDFFAVLPAVSKRQLKAEQTCIQALVVHVCIGQKPALRRRDHDQLPGIRFPQVSIGITAAFVLFQCHCIKQIFHVHT